MPLAPDEPKLMPLALTKLSVPLVYVVFDTTTPLIPVCAPATAATDAVIVCPFMPNVTPLALPNDTVPLEADEPFAMMPLMPVCTPTIFGPTTTTLLPLWLRVMLLPPAKYSVPLLTIVCTPDVLPLSDTAF